MDSLTERLAEIYCTYKDRFSGAIFIANGETALFNEANGFANRDFSIVNTTKTKFDTASVTKTFTAVAVLQLIEKGMLQFTDKITDIIDLNGTKIPRDVNIEHLLTHTSGIADDADEEAGEDYTALFIEKPNYSIRNCRDFLPQFAYKEPLFKAGSNVRYNNCAFILLGLAIEEATDMDYRGYVTENIFQRCGMERTCFQAKDEICPDTAEGYYAVSDENNNFVKWKKNIYSFPPIGTADSGAFTTVGDLDVFIRALKKNVLLSPVYTDMIFMPHSKFSRFNQHGIWRAGYAFEFIESEDAVLCMYKEGGNPGVDAMLSYYPQIDITLNILSNQNSPLWEMNREMRSVLIDASINI